MSTIIKLSITQQWVGLMWQTIQHSANSANQLWSVFQIRDGSVWFFRTIGFLSKSFSGPHPNIYHFSNALLLYQTNAYIQRQNIRSRKLVKNKKPEGTSQGELGLRIQQAKSVAKTRPTCAKCATSFYQYFSCRLTPCIPVSYTHLTLPTNREV